VLCEEVCWGFLSGDLSGIDEHELKCQVALSRLSGSL
jgi:hypothetical protein